MAFPGPSDLCVTQMELSDVKRKRATAGRPYEAAQVIGMT
jgi:hypothetical protein